MLLNATLFNAMRLYNNIALYEVIFKDIVAVVLIDPAIYDIVL